MIAFLTRSTSYRVDTANLYVEFGVFSFYGERAVLGEIQRTYSNQTYRPYLRRCDSVV